MVVKGVLLVIRGITVVNSYVIYKDHCTSNGITPKTHLAYGCSLVDDLTKGLCQTSTAHFQPRTRITQAPERLQSIPHFLRRENNRLDCCVCSKRGAGQCHFTYFRCETCLDNSLLCLTECFKLYHTCININQ